jgi:LEA14-like dessication related protein
MGYFELRNKTTKTMIAEKKHLSDLHVAHSDWAVQLNFYTDEIKILQGRLGEISAISTDASQKVKVGHFESQLIIQQNELDVLLHDIQVEEDTLVQSALDNTVAVDHRLMTYDVTLEDRITTFSTLFTDLRKEMNDFFVDVLA